MKTRYKQSGRTLAEMAVVIAAIVLLGSFGLPAIRTILDSFESGTGPKPLISAALASARAIAAREQRYAGIRFQKAYNPNGPLGASQYMIFIVYEEPGNMNNLTVGFRAVEGLEPIKLPDSVGVMDLSLISANTDIDDEFELNNAAAFSIIFSPSGKLVIHDVRVRNRDGVYDPDNTLPNPQKHSMDDIFNSPQNIINQNMGMFVQDDYPPFLDRESSRRGFVIYDRLEFKRAFQQGMAYSGYLQKLLPDAIYINPYMGTMIKQ
jgi:hypothetical protein